MQPHQSAFFISAGVKATVTDRLAICDREFLFQEAESITATHATGNAAAGAARLLAAADKVIVLDGLVSFLDTR